MGVVSPFGIGEPAFREGVFAGRSGIGAITRFDCRTSPVRIAAEVPGFRDDLVQADKRFLRVMSRQMQFGSVAVAESLRSAGLADADAVRTNIAWFASVGRHDFTIDEFGESFKRALDDSGRFDLAKYYARGYRAIYPLRLLTFIPNVAALFSGIEHRIEGETNTYTSEAASGLQAIGVAAAGIREGRFDAAICGACDARISPFGISRMIVGGMLAEGDDATASRPFDRLRRGFVVGEGAAFLVVESEAHARARGARPLAEIAGWGAGSDAYHPSQPHPEGRGLRSAMRRAMAAAGVSPSDVDLVVAAAAGSTEYDAAESRAIGDVFGSQPVAVTAPAGAIGRTQAASGIFNALVAVLSSEESRVPVTVNTTEPDEQAPAGLVFGGVARARPVRRVLANGYSVGGQCASVLIRRVES